MRLAPFGRRAALVDLDIDHAPDRAVRTRALAAALRDSLPSADVVVGAGNLLVAFPSTAPALTLEGLDAVARSASPRGPDIDAKVHVIAVAYDGPDLDDVARAARLDPSEIIALHTQSEVTVELVGFLPGFAYMTPLDARLALARRPSPRPLVARGSVGLAGGFTGIYPFASPGGWNLIGRALDVVLFDPRRDPPTLLRPGDRVRFESAAAPIARARSNDASAPAAPFPLVRQPRWAAEVTIAAAPVCATIQDAGRPGLLHAGVPASGPLDPISHAAANGAVGNAPDAAAIEIPLGSLEIVARGRVTVSLDGAPAAVVEDGERFVVAPGSRAVRYLALRGGIAVPLVLGSRSTLLVAKLGGFGGRPLRRGDVLPVGDEVFDAALVADPVDALTLPAELVAMPGPHGDRFPAGAFDRLLDATWSVSKLADRVGVRLDGPGIPRDGDDRGLPCPMLRGAIQIATDGTPIVLGPDHPTTGGYPVLAVLTPSSCAALARLPAGAPVRIRAV